MIILPFSSYVYSLGSAFYIRFYEDGTGVFGVIGTDWDTWSEYLVASSTLHMIYYFILISSFFMITFRKDKRGLHDVICNTKVVNCDK